MKSKKNKINKVFESHYFDLNNAIEKSYIDDGIGCLAVKIDDYDDVISRYSGKGFECLNPEFYHYINRNIQYIPSDLPILLQIYGTKLTPTEQEKIIETIREHYSFKLGEVIEANKARTKRICVFAVMGLIFLILSILTEESYEAISTFLNLVFCFYGSAVIAFTVNDITGSKEKRIRAGQLANMYIIVDEKYNDNKITEQDKQIIYDFLKQNSNKVK